ncbi:geranylgeranyl diphosphate synthase type I [Stackebrandtia albiflava]|uniref:Geranylgeranyl diphosphate synthase type I n=1 Tax=Stackebrandtia albiflava TaxID=406432 RepID=A0A562V3Y4_9ACTN|nr:family 2 encapsulin nanocompartment cargo protein polyprenyl transferase [Stackebrandtia albiflava]TWJ12532.1 geranylgeranyl diphosphate synthase type I [Stackebrandtia albiflava]
METVQAGRTRTAAEVIDHARRLVDPALRGAVDTLGPSMRRIAGYHLGWWDADGTPVRESGGKAIRPALTVLCAEAVGATGGAAVPVAVAVELVHNFSLLHDDVIDRDTTRRHRPTAWTVFGRGDAILAGDALSTLAVDVVAGSGHPHALEAVRMVNATVQELIDGQSVDMAFESRDDVGVAECRAMAESKTGALLSCACALGALYGGGDRARVAALAEFGGLLGLAFQFVDDLLGIWGDPALTGKPAHSDLGNRKKSLPVVAALNSRSPQAVELAELYHGGGELDRDDQARAARLIEEAGGRAWSTGQADSLLDLAMDRLAVAELPDGPTAELAALARLVTRRDH